MKRQQTVRPLGRDLSDTWTREETLDVLAGALSAPASRMDVPLIRECLLILEPEYEEANAARGEKVWRAIAQTIAQPQQKAAPRRRVLAIVLAATLIMAMAAAAIAAAVNRGVFNFLWDFGFSRSAGTVQPAAQTLLHSNLAHMRLANVDVDVREAVYDGHELRVVYSVWERDATEMLTEEDRYLPVIDAGWADGLTCCDWIEINGQDSYFGDTFQAIGEKPGEMLYYLQTVPGEFGVVIEGDTLSIGLPMQRKSDGMGTQIPDALRFTIPAAIPEGMRRTARPVSLTVDNTPISLTLGEFSPISAMLQLTLTGRGKDADQYAYAWGGAQLYTLAGERLGITTTTSWGSREPGLITVDYTVTPPDSWPDEMILAMPIKDGSPDPDRQIPIVLE